MSDYEKLKRCDSQKIRTLFSVFKKNKIKLYESMLDELDEFNIWSLKAERLLAYHIVNRKLRDYSKSFQEKVKDEIRLLVVDDEISH